MSGRPRRGPGRPRIVDTGMSPTRCIPPASPLTPDSEEGFIVNDSKSRTRGRPKGPIKKTRVNAQSKLKSPIHALQSASNVDSSKADCNYEFKKDAVDAMGQPIVVPETVLQDEIIPEDKLCAFCSCGPERRMYQGKLQLCAPTPGFNPFKKVAQNRQKQNSTSEPFEPADTGKEAIDDVPQPQPMVHRRGPGRPPGRGRKKGSVVIGLPFRNNGHALTADKCMFGSIRERDVTEVFESDGSVWAHHCCASWSDNVCQLDSYDFINVDKAVLSSLTERCAHCSRYGASVVCQVPKCKKTYHYPCAASAGAFQEIQSMTMLCPDHLEDAGRLGGAEAQCYLCGEAKDFSEMLFCTSCGRHYHGRCLDPAVDPTSLVRMSWQCPDCKVCQGCRQPGDDNKMLVCDVCDKGYHTYCLDPPMTTIPKTGWKCVGCRRCEDCGSNTPGGGPTSRWHRHYTVCDSCYQQRNKGLFCQICSRAYRQLSDVAMVQCVACEKWLHAECDNVTEDVYRKITAKKIHYFCPQCKENGEDHALLNHKNNLAFDASSINDVDPPLSVGMDEDKRTLTSAAIGRITPSPMDEDLTLIQTNMDNNIDDLPELRPFEETLMDSLDSDSKLPIEEEMESVIKPELDMFDSSSGLPDSPPTSDHNVEPKPLVSASYRPLGFTPPKSGGKRKLGPRLKSRGSTPARKKVKHGRPGRPPSKFKKQASVQPSPGKENVSGAANVADSSAKEEEPEGLHTTVVLFSSDDKFTSEQDMCLCCGSFGKGREGQLIACSQCGQSYHPYCVGVKVNKIILEKGWRCLDCTLCEGCGKGSDEARLLLCDTCDISYHTYCLDPPLEKVPQGGWKCKWCVSCYECGSRTPGGECEWQSNYTQCGPCASKMTCPVCNIKYNENDLMIQCLHCDRWLHGSCDKLLTEEEVDKAAEYGYHCLFCRPKTKRALVCLSGMSTTSSSPSCSSTARSLSSFLFTTSGTKPLGPPSPRATALHHYRPQFSNENHPPQPQAKPIHPCQRLTNNGIIEMKLAHDHGRGGLLGGSQGLSEVDNTFLTDNGIKQMNRLKLSPYGRKKVKVKRDKTKKMGLANLDKMSMLSPDSQANPLNAFNFNASTMEQKGDVDYKPGRSKNALRPGVGGFIVKGRGSGARKFGGRGRVPGRKKGFGRGRQSAHISANLPNYFAQQQSSLEAIMDSSSNEAWPEESDMMHSTPLQDAYPDWMQEAFFGKGLLNINSKKRKSRNESASENEKDSKDAKSVDKKPDDSQPGQYNIPSSQSYPFANDVASDGQLHPQPGHPGQEQGVYSRPDQPGTSVMALEGSENWHGSNVEGLPADPLSLSEEFPNPDVLYRSLDMLGDDMSSADCQNVNRDQEQAHIQAAPVENPNTNTSASSSQPQQGVIQPANRNQGDLDLLSVSLDPLPHVNCQEVEDIFADLELEMEQRELYSGIGPNQSVMPQQVPRPGNEPPHGHPPPPYQPPHQDIQGFPQGNHPQGMDPTIGHFDTNTAPGFPQFGPDRDNFRRSQPAPIGGGGYGFDAEHDFTKRTDLDLASDLPRERRRAPSPRTDPMKQQQKWQEDEKLGDTATISPVLYANLEHTNLQKEYPDWPNRYRAIARLWRKLSVEQREPYRLKARDNRVRLKDQGKRLLLEQSKEKGKSGLSEVPESPASEPMTPNPLSHVQEKPTQVEQQQPQQQQQSQNLMPIISNNQMSEKDQQSMAQSNTGLFPGSGFPPVPPSSQFQQDQQHCQTPLTPMSISSATPPMTPTSYTPPSPINMFAAPRMGVVPGGKSPKTPKSKKTKEDREKDKEKRKQKLLIQQQQEREWKMLQQRRQLEQQRQQQQSQQETNLLRQEVKRTQQVKGLRALDDKKKKSPPKMTRKPSLSEFSVGSGKGDDSNTSVDTPQQSPAVSMHSDDSFSLINASSLDTLDTGIGAGAMRRNSLPNLAMSQHGLENVRPLSPITTTQDRPPLVRSLSQQPLHSSWNDWSNDSSKHDQNSPMWSNVVQQPQPINDQNKPNFSNPVVSRQNSRQPTNDECFMQHQSKQHLPESTVDLPFQADHTWKSNDSQGPPLTPGLPKRANGPNQMPPQEHSQGDIVNMPFHQQSVMSDQQSLVHEQQDVAPQWHPEMHGNHPQPGPQDHMGIVQQNVPQQPTLVMQQNQGQPRRQHPDMSRQQSYEFQGWQETSSGPTSMAFQQPQIQQAPHQQQAPMQLGPQTVPVQPMTSMSSNMQQQSQPGISQVPIQPGPPPAPPPPPLPLPPPQHGPNLPMPRQPPVDDQQQQQQLEMLQKQQREQLMRAQQQQFLQMQLQQQQHLLQQQQQQQPPQLAVQPPFARPRMNQVLNTKDMPEIESEEEHQERLRFLYRQRQIQKQHMQMQAQQNMLQQQWPGQGMMPGVMPNDSGNPQGMPPIRPQPGPDMMQQQLFMEYQRRMNQRLELGQQTVQFDKVMQDLQQQQGVPSSGPHTNPPFMEVSHQRFALRHPNAGMQNNPMSQVVPGQAPMFGMDGQQLYRMQMQQQMMMQQQTPQRMLLQKAKVQPNTAAKQSVPEKDTNIPTSLQPKADEPDPDNRETSEVAKEGCVKPSEGESIVKTVEDSSTPVANHAETDKNDTASDCTLNKNEKDASKQVCADTGDNKTSDCASNPSTEVTLTADAEKSAHNSKSLDNVLTSVTINVSGADGNGESQNEGNKETSVTSTVEKNSDETDKVDNNLEEAVPASSEDPVQQKMEDISFLASGQQPPLNQQAITAKPRPQDALSQQMQPPAVSTPHTPSVTPSSNQQQALQQQLVATQQRFFQMQQQRQIMMQQYQQLQQQLQQNQGDPMLSAQLMALQQQAQFLQQNMLQTWQQLQMLQQQLQTSNGFQPQQMMPQNPVQGPMQGPQWQGPTQDQQVGMMPQHPVMMNKPGMIPPMPGQLLPPDGTPSPKGDKPGKKPRRSRAKVKDTFLPQSSPLQDWMNPQPVPPKPKGKGRKGKKQDDAMQEQELHLQQQLLRQQILQGMEQRHRLLQQQQQQQPQHGPIGRDNPGMLNHPEMSGSPRDLGPPTPQSLDGSTPQPTGQDPHFAGSPSMGIMTPEQINLSTSQLMNNTLAFHGNPTPPASQGNPRPPPNTNDTFTRSLNHPMTGAHPRNTRPNSQPQRFPRPQDRFQNFPSQQQQQQQKQPVVQYVADNNPFSDDFQIQKVVPHETPEPIKIFPKQEVSDNLTEPSSKHDSHLSGPAADIQEAASQQLSALDAPATKTMSTVPEQSKNEVIASHGETACDTNVANVKSDKVEAPKNNENTSNEQQGDNSSVDGKKGVSSQALQKLESMVADMGGEEASNLHGEPLDSEICFDLFNTNPDEEVANLCSPRNKDQQMVSIAKSSSQANSVASLECHEEVPSFVSPVQEVNAEKTDNKNSSQVNSPTAHLPETFPQDSSNISLTSNTNASDPVSENSEPTSFVRGRQVNKTQIISTAELTSVSEQLQQSVAPLSTSPETCTVSASLVTGSDVTVSSVSSGVFGGHLQLPTESDMGMLGTFTSQSTDTAFSIRPSNQDITPSQPDHGAMLLSGRDPMLGAANPVLSSSTTTPVMLNPAPIQKSPAKQQKPKVKRIRAEPRSRDAIREEDIIKKTLQEARKQEYERKKREYEEQQRRKREMQKELRQQKARQKEERKRQRLLNSPSKVKSKENQIQKVRKGDNDVVISKDSLPLCEPKLILTHALMHPYGTSPFNGQCSLKGALGNAHIDNSIDYYAKFPTPSLELVLKINQQKSLVNGDNNTDILDTKDFLKLREPDLPIKRARHMATELAPTAAFLSTDTASVHSLSSSPDTLQYVASSSPESDPIYKSNIPRFSALDESNRSNNDSPVFSPINPLNIKSERLLTTSCCSARSSDAISDARKDNQATPPNRTGPLLGLDQDIDDLDSINVTLTLSPSSEIRVSETVASVAELIGCSPPRPSDIVIEPSWKTGGSTTTTVPTTSGSLMFPHPGTPQGLSVVLSPKEGENAQKTPYPFSQFNLSTTKHEPPRKPSDGPYCRHCDVLIIGIGVIRGPPNMTLDSSEELREIENDSSSDTEGNSEGGNYKMYNINVQADERRDCFCSETCLKQYYSPLEAKSKTENTQEQSSDSKTTVGSGNVTSDADQDNRGAEQAEGLPVTSMAKMRRPSWKEEQKDNAIDIKRRREIKWRRWQAGDFTQKTKPDHTAEEISELLDKYDAVFKSEDLPDDSRICTLCSETGDGDPEGPSRLLNLDVDVWVHLNCALWSLEVYETLNGALMNVESAIKRGNVTECCVCKKTGATVVCNHINVYNKLRCPSTYHFGCALQRKCMFFKDKTMLCEEHKPNDDSEHRLPSYAVFRKVFINRDEIQQIASMLRHNQESGGEKLQTLRIGSVVVKSLGQLLLHQLQTFHTRNAVYPVGFKTIRYYWSMHDVRKRCQYYCSVQDLNGMPNFTIRTQDNTIFSGKSPKDAWNQILLPIQSLRKENDRLNLWPSYITGEDLFGLTEQYVVRIIESMPGVDYMQGYNMRYGPSPIMELPLAVNPTGSARSEPHIRSRFKTRTRAIRNTSGTTGSTSRPTTSRASAVTTQQSVDDTNSLYMKHFVHSKASQYRKLKSEWRQNVVLGRSNIQGLGLFANREIEPNSMVIEYIGSIIRNEVANRKEGIYESQNRGIYMFRIDSEAVIDATMAGGPARYINHSCMPNCVAEVVTFEKEQKIIIISNRKVERGEELTYDYKFDFEDDEHKISCLCGAPNCRKWMN